MFRNLIVTILMLLPVGAAASPTPFGMELGETTLEEVKTKYRLEYTREHKYLDNGKVYEIDTSEIEFDGLRMASAVFNDEKVLVGVVAVFDKNRFHDLHEMLSGKYKIILEKIPRLGDKEVEYIAKGGGIMELNAPHLSHSASLEYIDGELLTAIRVGRAKERRRKRYNEASQL